MRPEVCFRRPLSESGSEYTLYVRWPHDFRSEDFTDIQRDEVKRSGSRKYASGLMAVRITTVPVIERTALR